jgi:hypothetical protein
MDNSLHRRNPSRGDKSRWIIQPLRTFLIMGDSNISKLPHIYSEQVQTEAYPGAKIKHAIRMMSLLLPKGEPLVTQLILSFGLNDRELGNATQYRTDISKLHHTATLAFPNAGILIPLINYSPKMPLDDRINLNVLNRYIQNYPHIPLLPSADFHTMQDYLHWTPKTAIATWIWWKQHTS